MGETEKLVKAPENGQHMSLLCAEMPMIIWMRTIMIQIKIT